MSYSEDLNAFKEAYPYKQMAMDNHGEIIIYQTEDGLTKNSVNLQDETVWLPLNQMAKPDKREVPTYDRDTSIYKQLSGNNFRLRLT